MRWRRGLAKRSLVAQVASFGIVGFLGTLTNSALFFGFVDVLGLEHNIGAAIAFLVSVTQNFILNRRITFQQGDTTFTTRLLTYFKYVGVSVFGLAIDLLILNWLMTIHIFSLKTPAQVVGITFGSVANYIGSRLLAFRVQIRRHQSGSDQREGKA
jgi:putative flippase GtrA